MSSYKHYHVWLDGESVPQSADAYGLTMADAIEMWAYCKGAQLPRGTTRLNVLRKRNPHRAYKDDPVPMRVTVVRTNGYNWKVKRVS